VSTRHCRAAQQQLIERQSHVVEVASHAAKVGPPAVVVNGFVNGLRFKLTGVIKSGLDPPVCPCGFGLLVVLNKEN
jgi:hypothetical protein